MNAKQFLWAVAHRCTAIVLLTSCLCTCRSTDGHEPAAESTKERRTIAVAERVQDTTNDGDYLRVRLRYLRPDEIVAVSVHGQWSSSEITETAGASVRVALAPGFDDCAAPVTNIAKRLFTGDPKGGPRSTTHRQAIQTTFSAESVFVVKRCDKQGNLDFVLRVVGDNNLPLYNMSLVARVIGQKSEMNGP